MMKMKFSTGSSSSSVASDTMSRKSTLCIYAEMDNPNGNAVPVNHCEKMNSGSEMMELRRELDTVHRALHQQSESVLKHRHKIVELTQKLSTRDGRVEREKKLREDQLATVLRSLYLLEARLKKEQKDVQRRLKQKDIVIQSQQEEIVRLKTNNAYCKNCQQILGFTSEQTNIETDPEFLSLESMDSRCHNGFIRSSSFHDRPLPIVFHKNTRLSKSFQLPKSDAAYMNTSSSEEGNPNGCVDSVQGKGTYVKNKQAFVRKDVVRRSRKYSGRKHNSTYLNTIQKRYSSHTNSSSTEDGPGERQKTDSRVYGTGDDTADEISQDIQRASEKIDRLKEKIGEKDQKGQNENENQTYKDETRSFGSKMDRLHGIKRQTSEDIISNRAAFLNNVLSDTNNEKPWYANISDPEPELECEYNTRASKLNYSRSKSADNLMTETFDDGVFRAEVVAAKNEVLCSRMAKERLLKVQKHENKSLENSSDSKMKHENECENENWYASASDQDDGLPCEIYKNNPVLECVNQILLQNSLDESSNDTSKSSDAPSPRATTKKVQFSTLNSISFDSAGNEGSNAKQSAPPERRPGNKIVKFSLETASEHSYEVPNTVEGYNYEIQSIYSNDYEPIITKGKENVPEQGRPIPLPRTVNVNKSLINRNASGFVKNIAANIESGSGLHYYIDMEARERILDKVVNKRKVPRIPPALPPKPKNLVSKFRLENTLGTTDGLPGDSDAVVQQQRQRIADVTRKRTGVLVHSQEPDYCSISEINVPVVANGKREMILTQPTIEIHTEQFPQHSPVRTSLAKVATVTRLQCTKPSDRDIPKLPQVTEIIIPEEELETKTAVPQVYISPDRCFILNKIRTSNNSLSKPVDARNSIQMGNSVSSILSEINRGANFKDKQLSLTALDQKCTSSLPRRISSEPVLLQNEVNPTQPMSENIETNALIENDSDKFDLSQNFEEFKLEDCEFGSIIAEEYRISSESDSSDIATEDITIKTVCEVVPKTTVHCENVINNYRIEFSPQTDVNSNNLQIASTRSQNPTRVSLKNGIKLTNKPDLLSNIDNVETESVRNSDIESSNSSASNSGSYNTVKCDPNTFLKANETHEDPVSFDFFLETSGLSSKSIMTPSRKLQTSSLPRPLSSNHKSVLKPKDLKIRIKSQGNATNHHRINDKTFNTAVKYFEPYL